MKKTFIDPVITTVVFNDKDIITASVPGNALPKDSIFGTSRANLDDQF